VSTDDDVPTDAPPSVIPEGSAETPEPELGVVGEPELAEPELAEPELAKEPDSTEEEVAGEPIELMEPESVEPESVIEAEPEPLEEPLAVPASSPPATPAVVPEPAAGWWPGTVQWVGAHIPWAIGAGFATVAIGGWLLAYAVAAGSLPSGTTIGGVDIGGLSPADAERRVADEFGSRINDPIAVTVGSDRFTVDPVAAGFSLDPRATVDAADRPGLSPVRLFRYYFTDHRSRPLFRADAAKCVAALRKLAATANRPPAEGQLTYADGSFAVVNPKDGRTLRVEEAAVTLREEYVASGDPITLPANVVPAKASAEELRRVLAEVAKPAVAEPVTLMIGTRKLTVGTILLGKNLRFTADGNGRLQPQLDGAGIVKGLGSDLEAVNTPARDATFRISAGRPFVVPAASGREVTPAAMAKAILPVLTRADNRTAVAELAETQPKFSTAQATALGITEKVSSFTTRYPTSFQPRVINIGRATQLLNGALVKPGETFSLNDRVGERTAANGFARGYIIEDGRLKVDYGGGTSQVATTTYNAAFFAGLKDVEHHPHSFYISRYPEGREATVAWRSLDLRFLNDSGNGIYIQAVTSGGTLTVTMWGTKVWTIDALKSSRSSIKPFPTINDVNAEPECVPSQGVEGFTVTVTRIFRKDGGEIRRESDTVNYDPEPEVNCGVTKP
jgi:vancomycin resistance protein YoaR